MSPSAVGSSVYSICFPRVSGDEPSQILYTGTPPGFSPRERG